MGVKLHVIEGQLWTFHCPGCGYDHAVQVDGHTAPERTGPRWGWNGSMSLPTFTPSIKVFGSDITRCCHSFVANGKIQFLADCFHALAGQTVEIPDWVD